jgi:hypothetical protein
MFFTKIFIEYHFQDRSEIYKIGKFNIKYGKYSQRFKYGN